LSGFYVGSLFMLPLALKHDIRYHTMKISVNLYLYSKNSKNLALVKIRGIAVSSTQIRDLPSESRSINTSFPVLLCIIKNKLRKGGPQK